MATSPVLNFPRAAEDFELVSPVELVDVELTVVVSEVSLGVAIELMVAVRLVLEVSLVLVVELTLTLGTRNTTCPLLTFVPARKI